MYIRGDAVYNGTMTTTQKTQPQPHCRCCGNTDREDLLDPELEGYSRCCGKWISYGEHTDCFHS